MEIISVADLKVGMFVVEPDCPWTNLPFALQGFLVSDPGQIETFRRQCRFVHIDRTRSAPPHYAATPREADRRLDSRQLGGNPTVDSSAPADRRPLTLPEIRRRDRRRRFLNFLHQQDDDDTPHNLASELARLEPRFDDFQATLSRVVDMLAAAHPADLNPLKAGLHELTDSLTRNPDALMWLIRLKRQDEYSFDHALEVAAHLLLLGIHIGWQGDRLHTLGLAGLLQDIGKTQIPAELLTKTEQLTSAERRLLESHVASSLDILCQQASLSPDVLVIISRHHERWDGSGYPRGLRLNQIGLGAEMAGLVDSFCAMLKNKPYRTALGHQAALEELHALRDSKFNPTLMEQFVQCVGLYPIGTYVELSTGEVGVIVQQNRVQRSRPRVLVVLDANKTAASDYRVVDLRLPAAGSWRIVRALPRDAYGLDRHDFLAE